MRCVQRRRKGEVLVPANFNTPGQIVLSGSIGACERAATLAETKGMRGIALKVAGAFHSPFMQSAADHMTEVLAPIPFHPANCPVISNVTAQPHTTADQTKRLLVQQVIAPVRHRYPVHRNAAGIGRRPVDRSRAGAQPDRHDEKDRPQGRGGELFGGGEFGVIQKITEHHLWCMGKMTAWRFK